MVRRARATAPPGRPAPARGRLRRQHGRRPPGRAGHAAARLHAQRRPLGDLRRLGPRLRHRGGREAHDPEAERLDRRAQATPGRARRHGRPRHPRPRLAREKGRDLVGVMAFVQRPLAAVLAQPAIRSPRDLEGRRAGVTGLPSDSAVLRSVVQGAGGDPRRVRETTIGFEAVKALLARRVAGATAFWNVEGVALHAKRPGMREFRVDDFGAPAYPELVLCVTRATLEDRRPLVRATIRALQRGYADVQQDPESAVSTMLAREPGLDRASLSAQLDAVAPAFTAGADEFGQLQRATLRAWNRWDARFGILKRPIDVTRAFDTTLVGKPPPQ